jgi:hypothetical protein
MIVLLVATLAGLQMPSTERIEAALRKSSGERKYVLKQEGKAVGSLILKTTPGEDAVVFEDTLEGTLDGAKLFVSTKETAAVDGLALLAVKRTFLQGGQTVSIADGKAEITTGDRKDTVAITRRTIGESAVFRLLAAAEQKVGVSFTADVLSTITPELQKDWSIRCAAKEQIEIGGRKVETFRWEMKWEEKRERDGKPVVSRREETYWLDADGRLLRNVVAGGLEVELEIK